MEYLCYIVVIFCTKKVVVSSERSLVHPALENIKLVNYDDRTIVTIVRRMQEKDSVF